MFRKYHQSQELAEQKRHYLEQSQQAEQAHAAFFAEIDHLKDVCSLLLKNRPNRCIQIDQIRYNITRLRDDGPTRLLITDGQKFVDCSFDSSFIDIAEGERRVGQPVQCTSQYIAHRHKPVVPVLVTTAVYTERFTALQEELLAAAGYLEISNASDDIGRVATLVAA